MKRMRYGETASQSPPAESNEESLPMDDQVGQSSQARETIWANIISNMQLVNLPSIDRVRKERSEEYHNLVRQ